MNASFEEPHGIGCPEFAPTEVSTKAFLIGMERY